MEQKKSNWLIGLLGILFFAGLIFFLVKTSSSVSRGPASGSATTPTPKPTQTLIPRDPRVEDLKSQLNNPNLSVDARDSIEEKLAMAESMATQQAAGAQKPHAEKVAPTLPPSAAVRSSNPFDVPEGIFEGSQGMINPTTAQITNVWQGVWDGRVWQVFAGAPADNTNQGLLLVYVENPEKMNRTLQTIKSPPQYDLLTIISVSEGEITLKSANGSQIYFSLNTMKFHE
jgi:hypothetical protein